MGTLNAIGRLFPPSLFVLLGLELLWAWHYDPALMGISLCATALCLAWLIVSIIEVANHLHIQAPQPASLSSESAQTK